MAAKIVFSPPMPKDIMDACRAMVPQGYEMAVVERAVAGGLEAHKDAEYFIGFARGDMGPDFYKTLPKLKLVQLISAGYDRLDIAAAKAAGVPVANNGGANSTAVAEHTWLLILGVLKRLAWQHNNVVAGKWRIGDLAENRLYEAEGKTLGIVGLGTIGKKVARRAHGFDMPVIYYDVVRLTEDQENALGVRFVLLDELLREADVVSLHVPLNAATKNLMSTRQFNLMKPSAVLINTCRGPVVDEAALNQALVSGQIAGAGLDVMVEEPGKPGHPLYTAPNITITPHMAGPTWENWPKAFRNAFDNIQRVARGDRAMWIIPELR
ncbi:MAG TPA: 2-hydroxyacid dehydrogenase [Verrucomicrobiae bacterium]|nr:2-hydroxyacid dehydrogenase [Verrucomicrobiae bacterium]